MSGVIDDAVMGDDLGIVPDGEVSYYSDRYWNDLHAVSNHMTRLATGREDQSWQAHVRDRYLTGPVERALVIACGNGWVERELIDTGLAKTVHAWDASEHYLAEAESLRGERPIRYWRDTFEDFVGRESYDLIVNVAALHHARYLYRFLDELRGSLAPHGLFVHHEYVGPDRNQYSPAHTRAMRAANDALPAKFRTTQLLGPPLEAAVAGDPTEAVHSSEIIRALDLNFDRVEHQQLGGGLAYQLLWNNTHEFEAGDDESNHWLHHLLQQDISATRRGEVPNLFSFMVYRPAGEQRRSSAQHRFATRVREPVRERFADSTGGYYPGEVRRLVQERGLGTSAKAALRPLRGRLATIRASRS